MKNTFVMILANNIPGIAYCKTFAKGEKKKKKAMGKEKGENHKKQTSINQEKVI